MAIGATAVLAVACSRPVTLPVHQFQVPAPETWEGAATSPLEPETLWWEFLQDPVLDELIGRALDCNQNLRAAAARIAVAVEERHIVGAAELPEVSLSTNRLRQRQNFVGLPFPGLADRVLSNSYSNSGLTFNVSWEADIWNRLGAEKLAAEADVAVRRADRLAAQLSLSGQVAKAWYAAVEARRQTELARGIVSHLETVAERTRERYRYGSRSPVDVRVAESDIARAEATLRERERAQDLFVRQVEMLACEYPSGERVAESELPSLPLRIPAGLPSELVHRRPDLAAAEQGLLAADARTVQARAALRPSFSLTAAAGTASNTLLDLVNPNLQIWNYALGFTQPLFNRGRLKANIRAFEARALEATANYEGLLWTAYLEVESALASEETLRAQHDALGDALESTRGAVRLAEQRYGAGMGDIFSVLTLRRSVLETEIAMLALQRARVENRVDLHLALGGNFGSPPTQHRGLAR